MRQTTEENVRNWEERTIHGKLYIDMETADKDLTGRVEQS